MKDEEDIASTDPLESVLRRGLQTDPLWPEAMQRIRAAVETEWRSSAAVGNDTRKWNLYASAAAAAMLLLIGGLFVVARNPAYDTGAVLGNLERMEYPGVVEQHSWSRDREIDGNEPLHGGQRIMARGGARIALASGGTLRVAAGTRFEVASAHQVILRDGDLYVDVPPASTRTVRLSVQTPAGNFTHIGTQFQVAVHAGRTDVRVREGVVRWASATATMDAAAGTHLMFDEQGGATTSQIDTAGAEWIWAETLAGAFEIDNRSLTEFLRAFARETGRTLVFADPSVEHRADETRLHGSVQRLSQMEALSAVMATTSFRFTLDASSVRIESGGDSSKNTR